MDSITQAVLGGAIAELGFRERLGNKAVIFGACCGLLPDLDIITSWHNTWTYIIHHRGFSHSILVLALLTPLLGWAGYCWGKKNGSYFSWSHLAFWALITHPILDLFTSYGTQIFWPFSDARLAFDAIAIIDFCYTLPLLLAIVIGYVSKLSFRFRKYFATCMFLITTSYLLLGYANNQEAIQLAKQQLESEGNSQQDIKIIRATPTLFNIGVWRIIICDATGRVQVGMVSTFNPQKIKFISIQNTSDDFTQKALENPYGKIFCWFAMDLVTSQTIITEDEKICVYLHDQRYGLVSDPSQNLFSAYFIFNQNKEIESAHFLRQPVAINFSEEWLIIWKILTGNCQE